MQKVQKIGVTAFIYYDNMVLLVKRSEKESFLPGYFELPGGHVKFGETPSKALNREIKEETGLSIKILHPYSAFSYLSKDNKRHTVDIQYVAIIIDDEPNVQLSEEHDDSRWINEDELGKITKITKDMKNAIQKGFQAINI